MTAGTAAPALTQSIEIAAPPERVWELVRDPRTMSRWSPQTQKSFKRTSGDPRLGTRFINVNRRGILVWPTNSKIVRFTEGSEIAWRVKDNYTVWSLTLTPNATGGTTVTQARETPDGISEISRKLTVSFFGGVQEFSDELRRDMLTTLTRIKADAER